MPERGAGIAGSFLSRPRATRGAREDARLGAPRSTGGGNGDGRARSIIKVPEGKRKKCALNQRRKSKPVPLVEPEPSPPPETPGPGKEIPPLLVGYVQRMVSAIEGRRVSREEILAMLAKEKRQHSIVRQRRMDQIIRSLHERPP